MRNVLLGYLNQFDSYFGDPELCDRNDVIIVMTTKLGGATNLVI